MRCCGWERDEVGIWDEIKKTQWWLSQSRKESILSCLLKDNMGFIYKNVLAKLKRVEYIGRKIKDGNENRGRQAIWNDLLQRRNDKLMAACLKIYWTWKVKNIVTWNRAELNVYYHTRNKAISQLYNHGRFYFTSCKFQTILATLSILWHKNCHYHNFWSLCAQRASKFTWFSKVFLSNCKLTKSPVFFHNKVFHDSLEYQNI